MNAIGVARPVVLCILDGWGHRLEPDNNAIMGAATPTYDRLVAAGPFALLDASEGFVGLPSGQMGNSEVGHMNIGAGRVLLQDLPRIDADLANGRFAGNPGLTESIAALRRSGGTAHVLGLLSPGGVHSHSRHIAALLKALADAGVPALLHAFLDGRDTPPRSAAAILQEFLAENPRTQVATVTGRYYAMDRDQRWDRVERAYRTLVLGEGEKAKTAEAAITASYAADLGDEFVLPHVIGDFAGMADGDGLFMANFRADRAREILRALLTAPFDGFPRPRPIDFAVATGMVSYADDLDQRMVALYPPMALADTLGEVASRAGLAQLRIAETEKYAHVTFFLNGGREDPFPGEERRLIPSPKVATYDLQPEMSAPEVTDRLVEAIESGRFGLIICNFANGDMVGHTGKLAAAIQAVETLDRSLARIEAAVLAAGASLLVTADHGNCEQMTDPATGQAHTAHTLNKVPLLLVNPPAEAMTLADGVLSDIAPTVLGLMGLAAPAAMTGRSLLGEPVAAGRGESGAAAE